MRPDFVFRDEERDELFEAFLEAPTSPYGDYESFMDWVRAVAHSGGAASRYAEFCHELRCRDLAEEPIVLVRDCPIDRDLPVFDSADPVSSKYAMKRTFATEAFLGLHAVLTGTE